VKYFLYAFLVLIFVAAAIYFIPPLRIQAQQLLTYNECNTPLLYNLGSVDQRFGLTKDQVLQDLQQATGIWSTAAGKNLFAYSPKANLTVNFIYDQRQQLDTSINQLDSQLKNNNQTLKEQIAQYKSDAAAFEQKLAEFNATVDKYNKEGGAPPDVYQQLKQEQQQLSEEAQALNQRAKQLNLSTNSYNDNVSVLNSDIAQFNNVLSQKPEQGQYSQLDNTITIYFANNQDEMIHTLTHEFGHALGMEHVKDPNAIMYPYTTTNITVTPDDMVQLNIVCRNQSLFVHEFQAFGFWLAVMFNNLHQNFSK
jgi:hypothetical protein